MLKELGRMCVQKDFSESVKSHGEAITQGVFVEEDDQKKEKVLQRMFIGSEQPMDSRSDSIFNQCGTMSSR